MISLPRTICVTVGIITIILLVAMGCTATQQAKWTPENINTMIDTFQLLVVTDEVLNARIEIVQDFYATDFQMLVQMFTDLQVAWTNGTTEEWTEKYNAVEN